MKKVGFACDGTRVAEHFGHCEKFEVYTIDGDKVVSKETFMNPGHKPGFLPKFLNEKGINVIISGGMGGGAISLFLENNIEVITQIDGECDLLAQDYAKGKLEGGYSVCKDHSH